MLQAMSSWLDSGGDALAEGRLEGFTLLPMELLDEVRIAQESSIEHIRKTYRGELPTPSAR